MDSVQQNPKKHFCTRCFLPINAKDKVDVEGQNYHKICSMCCVCRIIPSSVKMFYGHVFCNECFKLHVLTRFKGENPHIHSSNWWMQWAPSANPQKENTETIEETRPETFDDVAKRPVCARCLHMIDQNNKVNIGGQNFHAECAKCYFCHTTPASNLKIYYGQVFCEECFHRHVRSQNKDNPSKFFTHCFEQWKNNEQFAENMKDFMCRNQDATPFVFMMQGSQPPFCGRGAEQQNWFQNNETKKSASGMSIGEESQATCDLSFENRTDVSDIPEPYNAIEETINDITVNAPEKIEKLTKYLHGNIEVPTKKWEKCNDSIASFEPSLCGWKDMQMEKPKSLNCPKCLWQCGSIDVRGKFAQNNVGAGEVITQ